MGCATSTHSAAASAMASSGFESSVVPHRRSSEADSCRSAAAPTPRVSQNGSFNIDDESGAAVFVRRGIYPNHSAVPTSSGGTFSPPPAAFGRNRRRDQRGSGSSPSCVGYQSPPPQRRQSLLSLQSASDLSATSASGHSSRPRWSGGVETNTAWQGGRSGSIGGGKDYASEAVSGGNATINSSNIGAVYVGSDIDVMDLDSSDASSSFTSICYSDGVAHSSTRHAPYPLLKLDGSSRTADLAGQLEQTPGENTYDVRVLDLSEKKDDASSDGIDSGLYRNHAATSTSFSDGGGTAGSPCTTILPPPGINCGNHLAELPTLPDVTDVIELE